MRNSSWIDLVALTNGEKLNYRPVGFIIDSPWIPGWYGIPVTDYYFSDEQWLKSNLRAINRFPDVWFMPGFWSEFGMCTEPSAFGARSSFPANEFPHAHKVINSPEDIESLPSPNPRTDGLLPFVLNRLKLAQPQIEAAGHKIRFAIARGPLNIASYLMGMTEFLTIMMLEPEKTTTLMKKITAFLKDWLKLQIETFPTIDGIFMLDDVIGFIGESEFREFGLPFFKELYDMDVAVKFLHNDAPCKVSAPFLPEIGVNLFNMGFDVPLTELKQLTQNKVTLLGNIPPRDVLASGDPAKVTATTLELLNSLSDKSRVILSCGGGMPPGVKTENIAAFTGTVKNYAG